MELDNTQRRIMAQFLADGLGGDADEYLEAEFALTRDGFDQFDGRNWHSSSVARSDSDVGFPNRFFNEVQRFKGDVRQSLWVVDFGDFRCCFVQ